MKILKHFVKVLLPFRYDVKGDCRLEQITVRTKREKEKHLFQKFGFEKVDMRNGLPEVFSSVENTSSIVKCYRVDSNSRKDFGLPERGTGRLGFHCRSKDVTEIYNVAITDVSLYLFESGVGFVELECNYESDDVAAYIDCNYFLCEIKSESNYFILPSNTGGTGESDMKFTVKQLLEKVLRHVPGVQDFYQDAEWGESIHKGIVYSYLYLDEKPKDLQGLLFHLRNNFKESYQMPVNDATLDFDPAVRKPFDNSYWTASYNGVTNVSIKTKNKSTNNHFEVNFVSSLHGAYFVLFLATLHQRFAVMQLIGKMGQLDKLDMDYETMRVELSVARKYQAEAANLKFRSFFRYPSYMEHINGYYEFLQKAYCIEELLEHFTSDLDNLEQLCTVYVEKIKVREEQLKRCKTAKIEIFVGIFGMIVGGFSLLNDALELVEKLSGVSAASFTAPVIITTVLLAVPSILVLWDAYNRIREVKSIKEEIRIEDMTDGKETEKVKSKKKRKKDKAKELSE